MKISLITIVYNNKDHIEDCLNSVLNQNYDDIEYVVIDGGSTDGTIEIISRYLDQITYFDSRPDKGLYDALNRGVSLATGDIVGILHSDDLFVNNEVVNDVFSVFEKEKADIVYAKGLFVARDNCQNVRRIYKASSFKKGLLNWGWIPLHTTIFVKREVFAKHGLYDLNYPIASDYDISLRWFRDNSLRKVFLDKYIVKMRLGGKSTSMNLQKSKSLQDLAIIKKHGLWGGVTLGFKLIRKVPQYLRPYFFTPKLH
ncbi:glycosyltransferase family 2 protein [Geofilum rubicundum]|uniref:Glycosyltransferase, group 2 family protein n=1 Tax=Geofilum rubicundum JCM 15548 TaxID=1236989 RepID=A0A0E9M282_9BACT|nr:glycosyltransferase family 2 protein [Geofilum rubicundum]GAO31486.1 glycosyltransferase, group 2 family protein [Geofilum rubicundum JCM 15548]